MAKIGYISIGGIGALVGINLSALIMGYQGQANWLAANHIGEAVLAFSILGIIYDLLPGRFRINPFFIVPISFLVGMVWEPLSFLVGFNIAGAMQVLQAWIIYATPTIFIIGLPVILVSIFMRNEKIVWGIDSVGITGRAMNFVFCMLIAMVLLILLFHFNVYGIWAGLFGIVV